MPENSDIDSLEDLAGKNVAYTVGSSANYTVVKALESVGLTLDDIESVPLAPADARAAFQGGSLDAWAIWAPFLTSAVQELGAKALVVRSDLVDSRSYFLASESFVAEHPDLLSAILGQLQSATSWADQNRDAYYELLTAETDIPVEVWAAAYENREFYPVEAVTPEILQGQQQVADTFFDLGVIPTAVNVQDIAWTWEPEGE